MTPKVTILKDDAFDHYPYTQADRDLMSNGFNEWVKVKYPLLTKDKSATKFAQNVWNAAIATQWLKKELPDSVGWWFRWRGDLYGFSAQYVAFPEDEKEDGIWYKIPNPPKVIDSL